MKAILILLLCCFIQQGCTSSQKKDLLFEDEFETFNTANWTKETHHPRWVNNELQAYSPEMVETGMDGDRSVLIITAKRCGDEIISGRINSKGKQSFPFSRVEASVKLPKTDGGLWPAFWMMGEEHNWPKCGEIDILEMGHSSGMKTGNSERHNNVAIHYGDTFRTHKQQYFADLAPHSLQDGEYHTFALNRTSDAITFLIDGDVFKTFEIPEGSEAHPYFQGDFFILFNLAVGGDFPEIRDISGLTALEDGEEVKMYVDWVRVSK